MSSEELDGTVFTQLQPRLSDLCNEVIIFRAVKSDEN